MAVAQSKLPTNYARVDAHALSAPASVSTSVRSLGAWLTKPFTTDEEKTRAIFRWIAQNITYDVDALFSGEPASGGADDALRTKRGVCEGYSDLFAGLAKAAGLTSVKISGFAKGYGYSAGQVIGSKPNHAWNAVKIGGQWKLLDCTWGAGYIGDDRRFHRAFNNHYFFTPPQEFIFDHLPDDKQWQLLDSPQSAEEFERSVLVRPKFFALGLNLSEHPEGTIQTDGESVIRFEASENVVALAQFIRDNRNDDERQTFVQQEGETLVIRIMPSGKGEYTLRLFGKSADEAGDYEWILDYRVESLSPPNRLPAYPRKLRSFDDRHVVLIEPFTGVLPASTTQKFRLQAPRALQAAVVVDQDWTFLQSSLGHFEGDATIGHGSITVCAKYPGQESWDILLEYQGK
ncbi:MAG TPA: transglutaminase domain-containing protein [Bacteroidota bacterium]|nr:transglutaminase domain-containing protein [Bacteroidota bacterium]